MAVRPDGPSSCSLLLGKMAPAAPSAMTSVLRSEMHALESRLVEQITALHEHGEKVREAMRSRLEDKISAHDLQIPRLERRVAELSGSCSGQSDELQAQIRRMDGLEERMLGWRHRLEETLQQKFADAEAEKLKNGSATQLASATVHGMHRTMDARLKVLEERLAAVTVRLDDSQDMILRQEEQCLTALELAQNGHAVEPAVAEGSFSLLDEAVLEVMPRQIGDLEAKLDSSLVDMQDVRVTLESQEEHIKALRTRLERQIEARWSPERHDDERLDKAIESVRAILEEQASGWSTCFEELSQRVDFLQDSAIRSALEDQRSGFLSELAAMRTESDLAPKLQELVEQLGVVGPRLMQHDAQLAEKQNHIDELHADVGDLKAMLDGVSEESSVRSTMMSGLLAKLQESMSTFVEQQQMRKKEELESPAVANQNQHEELLKSLTAKLSGLEQSVERLQQGSPCLASDQSAAQDALRSELVELIPETIKREMQDVHILTARLDAQDKKIGNLVSEVSSQQDCMKTQAGKLPDEEVKLLISNSVDARLKVQVGDLHQELQSKLAEMESASKRVEAEEESLLVGLRGAIAQVEERLQNINPPSSAAALPPDRALQLEALLARVAQTEEQCSALQEGVRGSIGELAETVPVTVEYVARLASALKGSLGHEAAQDLQPTKSEQVAIVE